MCPKSLEWSEVMVMLIHPFTLVPGRHLNQTAYKHALDSARMAADLTGTSSIVNAALAAQVPSAAWLVFSRDRPRQASVVGVFGVAKRIEVT
jgi:hypothetical protein